MFIDLSQNDLHLLQVKRDPNDLWLKICVKRDKCDKAMKKIKEVAFFFSSVAFVDKKVDDKECEEDEEDNEGMANKSKKKIYWPVISYWVALQSRDGLRVSTNPVHSALLDTGMEVSAKSVQEYTRGKEGSAIAPLCTTLKDHNNSFLQRKVDKSFEHCLESLESEILEGPVPSIHGSERVVRLQVTSPIFSSDLKNKAIPAITKAGLVFDVFGIENIKEVENQQSIGRALSKSPVVVALNKIERAVTKLGYALHKGKVFKRNEESMYTQEHAFSIKKFISLLANNEKLKEIIIPNFNKLESILADPECEFTKELKIKYDLIEVSNSCCFSLSRRAFAQHFYTTLTLKNQRPSTSKKFYKTV